MSQRNNGISTSTHTHKKSLNSEVRILQSEVI